MICLQQISAGKRITSMEKNIDQCLASIEEMAKQIYEMENLFDSSIKGVFFDMLVTSYVKNHGADFIKMYEHMMEHQTKERDTYGDLDQSITKLTITGQIGRDRDEYNYSATGMYLRDIFCDNDFIIVKVVEQHKTIERFVETHYHVRKIYEELKTNTIDFKKFVKYGDTRDDGYTVTFVIPKFDQPIRVKDDRGMAYLIERFEQALSALRACYHDINETEE